MQACRGLLPEHPVKRSGSHRHGLVHRGNCSTENGWKPWCLTVTKNHLRFRRILRNEYLVITVAHMVWRYFLVIFVLGTLCRPFALAGQAPSSLPLTQPASHLALHVQKKAHHHHEDGSITVDESKESIKHVVLDGTSGAAADLAARPLSSYILEASAPPIADERPTLDPYLPRLRRPPKLGT